MKNLTVAFLTTAVLAIGYTDTADAQVFDTRVKSVVNPPGLFNRQVQRANVNRGAAVVVNNAVLAKNFTPAFVAVTPVQTGFVVAANSHVLAPSSVAFVNRGRVRFNSFGTRTVNDAFGNVFEVDAFGNAVFRGNRLGIASLGVANVNTFATFPTVAVNVGGFNAVAVRSCFGH